MHLGFRLFRADTAKRFEDNAHFKGVVDFLALFDYEKISSIIPLLGFSKSQVQQDLFVALMYDGKREGSFVEFGAADGKYLSNTYLLEKELSWRGVLSEPARQWKKILETNRSAYISNECVWSESGKFLKFVEANELSTLDLFRKSDGHSRNRKFSKTYNVPTISLNDLLFKYSMPTEIDFMSIDTEGSEFEILENFDFDSHKVGILTVEHNYTEARDKIYKLMKKNKYLRVKLEHSRFDDWYISEKLEQRVNELGLETD
jgi:FkbM family methyltransferase